MSCHKHCIQANLNSTMIYNNLIRLLTHWYCSHSASTLIHCVQIEVRASERDREIERERGLCVCENRCTVSFIHNIRAPVHPFFLNRVLLCEYCCCCCQCASPIQCPEKRNNARPKSFLLGKFSGITIRNQLLCHSFLSYIPILRVPEYISIRLLLLNEAKMRQKKCV